MAKRDKLFWMQTLSDFLNQEGLCVEPNVGEDKFVLSSYEFGKIDDVNSVADIFELLEANLQDAYIGDLEDEAEAYNITLPASIHGVDRNQWEYWVELRNAYETGELSKMEGDVKEYFENHDYEFDVLELVTRHFEDFTIAEWMENTYYHEYRIGCLWQMYGHIKVRARNMEEARKAAKKLAETCPLPDDGEYLDDSFELDEENIEEVD